MIEGEPLPLESDLTAATDLGRFALRRLRRGKIRMEPQMNADKHG